MIDPILITGCARSGTSMTAGIINMSGAFGGVMAGPNHNNRKGMFENNEIRQNIVKPYLKGIKCDPKGQHPLPNDSQLYCIDKNFFAKWRVKVIEVMKSQGYEDGPWFYKGAKACLSWYLWHNAFPQAKWVIVRRERKDIVSSCMRTGFMNSFRHPEGWENWAQFHEIRFIQMMIAGLDVMEVWPQKMIDGDFSEIKSVIEWLGLEYNKENIKEFVAPELWKRGKK